MCSPIIIGRKSMPRAYIPEYRVIADVIEWNSGYSRVHFYKDGMEYEIEIPTDEIFIQDEEE